MCDYCCEAWKPLFRIIDGSRPNANVTVAILAASGTIRIEDKQNMREYSRKINFCPMCAQPLRGE